MFYYSTFHHLIKNTLLILFFFLLCNLKTSGQSSLVLSYQFPEKFDTRCIDIDQTANHIIYTNKTAITGISDSKIRQYANLIAFLKRNLFLSGRIYVSWHEMENYLNEVLQIILPDSLKARQEIHVYPARIEQVNAFTISDGSIFFNVGLFEKVTNEASIAIILGHEIGHYIMQDNLKTYFKIKKNILKSKLNPISILNLKYDLEYAQYSRRQEIAADSIGFLLAQKSGYNLLNGVDNFNRFQDIENERTQKEAKPRIIEKPKFFGKINKTEIKKLLAEYPENSERIERLISLILSDTTSLQYDFQVNNSLFEKLAKFSIFETLQIELENYPKECVKRSFIHYLQNPNDEDILYFLIESLRRLIAVEPIYKDYPFLTEDFLGKTFKKGEGILHNLSFLPLDSSKLNNLQATELANSDIIEFETYNQAFEYFKKAAISKKNKETFLSIALSEIDTVKRNQYLKTYLSFDSIRYKDYAIAMLNDTLYSCINKNTRDIFIFHNPEFVYYSARNFKETINGYKKFTKKISSKTRKVSRNIEIINSDDIQNLNLNQLTHFFDLIDAYSYTRKNDTVTKFDINKKTTYIDVNKGVDVFSLSPDNWYFCVNNNIKSLHCYSFLQYSDDMKYVYHTFDLAQNTQNQIIYRSYDEKPSSSDYKKYLIKFIKMDKKVKNSSDKMFYFP